MAIRIFNALQDEMGGIGWSGLDALIELYGIEDRDGLLERLIVIKTHKPEKDFWRD